MSVENYFDEIDPLLLQGIGAQVGGRDVVLKTHQRVHPEVAELIEAGTVLASASIRDPREIALSMLDHGRRSRRWGYVEFSEFYRIGDTLLSLDTQIANFRGWSSLANVRVFTYNEICFETSSVVNSIASQIGLSVDATSVLKPFKNNRGIGQFSRGAALRYGEMNPAEQTVFLERYASLFEEYSFATPAAVNAKNDQQGGFVRARGQLAQTLIQIRRYLRAVRN